MAGRRRAGIAILVALFAVGVALAHAPFDLGALRLAGVGLLWWYAFAVAPLAAALVTMAVLFRRSD
jgi:hypothetical protein